MNNKTITLFFALIRSVICEKALSEDEKALYNCEMLPQLIDLAEKHDLTHLLAFGLKNNELLENSEFKARLENSIFTAVYRYERQSYELERICSIFEEAKIPFIPLKGSVIRKYYPEPWMRTSCDIDILVHPEDLDRAIQFLIKNPGYTYNHKFTHDVSMYAKNGQHIELHYSLMEDEPIKNSNSVLNNIWDTAVRHNNFEYWYDLPNEEFYFYHIAHMAKHFENGGCGIRPFLDLTILNRKINFNDTKLIDILECGDLTLFTNQANLLAKIWFGKAEHTITTQKMEDYIIQGGVYGTAKNHIAIQQQKRGGKLQYAISKIWIPYDMIKFYHPKIGKYKILTPIMQFKRWIRIIFNGKLKSSTDMLKYNLRISKNRANDIQNFLQDIGL